VDQSSRPTRGIGFEDRLSSTSMSRDESRPGSLLDLERPRGKRGDEEPGRKQKGRDGHLTMLPTQLESQKIDQGPAGTGLTRKAGRRSVNGRGKTSKIIEHVRASERRKIPLSSKNAKVSQRN